MGALQEKCLDSIDGVGVWGASLQPSSSQKAGVSFPSKAGQSRKGGGPREAVGLAGFLSLSRVDRCQPQRVVIISLPAGAAFFQGILWEQGVIQLRKNTQGYVFAS